jgi:hypothetical protein
LEGTVNHRRRRDEPGGQLLPRGPFHRSETTRDAPAARRARGQRAPNAGGQ